MKSKTSFYCTNCGNESPRWLGRCPSCGQWNTLVEHEEKQESPARTVRRPVGERTQAKRLSEIEGGDEIRFSTGMDELDRVLGGGAVRGSLVLVGGAPGIGKSTLLLQICQYVCRTQSVLYVSGEESEKQLKMRAQRLQIRSDSLLVLSETCMEDIVATATELNPDVLIVDSIQTLTCGNNTSTPGSISQVKDCTMTLMQLAKQSGFTVFVVGHINKDGAIAGPKVLEHMVDCVMYFEGDRNTSYRLLRAAKNRFGSTNETGVFEMIDTGLKEVPNPSESLLSGRPLNAPGTCVACVMEGTRPMLAEVQALVTKSGFAVPRRTCDGFDYNRANLLMAVMEKRGGVNLSGCDAYLNIIGGLNLDEPGADLPVVIALASSFRDKPVDSKLSAIGEVGLTGEIRSVSSLPQRLQEIARLGFTRCIIPRHGTAGLLPPDGLELLRVRNIREAIEISL